MVQIKQSGARYFNKFTLCFSLDLNIFSLKMMSPLLDTSEANQFRFYYWVSKRALKRMSERKEAEI